MKAHARIAVLGIFIRCVGCVHLVKAWLLGRVCVCVCVDARNKLTVCLRLHHQLVNRYDADN